ncbi:hypothetical protein KGP36_00075 [Patescibacteria group bacterium]|nr:hypothetical protein [Patescibacteria group bacterium]
MRYPRLCSIEREKGIILADILVALALGASFAAILSSASADSRDLYEKARSLSEALDRFQAGGFASASRPYGNDRVETDYRDSSSPLSFKRVYGLRDDPMSAAGTPLCAVSFGHGSGPADASPLEAVRIALPADPLLPLTDLEVRDGIAYVSADSASASDPDLMVFDIKSGSDVPGDKSSGRNAILLSSIDTGPGISAIAIAGKRVYAAAPSAVGQLQVIRLDGLQAPILERRMKLPLPFATATPALGSSIAYSGGRIYLGTEKWSGDEFAVIDASDPAAPAKIGGFETGGKVNGIAIDGNEAYLASADQSELRVLDLSDPAVPRLEAVFSPSGWQRQEGKALSVFEGSLSFGRTSGGYDVAGDHEAFIWATASPALPSLPRSVNIPGGVYAMIMDRSRIFLATRQPDQELQAFSRDLEPIPSSSMALPVAPQTMACDGDKLYILARGAPYIYEISSKSR